jgi:RNase H-like domain found in reverse transcriptase
MLGLLKENTHCLDWTPVAEREFRRLMAEFNSTPGQYSVYPGPHNRLILKLDLSDVAIGCDVYMLKDGVSMDSLPDFSDNSFEKSKFVELYFYRSRLLNSAEMAYSIIEKKVLAFVDKLCSYCHLFRSHTTLLVIASDHTNILHFAKLCIRRTRHL